MYGERRLDLYKVSSNQCDVALAYNALPESCQMHVNHGQKVAEPSIRQRWGSYGVELGWVWSDDIQIDNRRDVPLTLITEIYISESARMLAVASKSRRVHGRVVNVEALKAGKPR